MLYLLFRYLHFFAIFGLAGALIIENMAVKPTINGEDARNLAKVDAVYGVCVVAVFTFGLVLWYWVGKPSAFYTDNSLFQIKLALFILMAILSVYPTLFFFKNRKSQENDIVVPKQILILLKAELFLLAVIPVLAYLMARGIDF